MSRLERACVSAAVSACSVLLVGCGPAGGGEGGGCTILLATFQSARHNEEARFFRDSLERSGWKDLTVLHKDNHSELFSGRYATVEEGNRDLAKAQSYTNARGNRPFRRARLVSLPGKDIGPPKWKLVRAEGTYTVIVCYFYDVPKENYVGRRRFAVERCRAMRKGGYEAYYHHGPVKSYVTVGTFGENALRTVRDGSTLKTVIADPGIEKVIRDFPILGDNGHQVRLIVPVRVPGTTQVQRKRVFVRPYPVKIPRRSGDDLPGSTHHGAGVWQLR